MKVLIATNNEKKLKELKRIFQSLNIQALSPQEANVDLGQVEETGVTFAENALLKAASACKKTGLISVSDDSGLCVDALNGEPGVFSARWGGVGATAQELTQKLLVAMAKVPNEKRTAYFECAICCVFPNGDQIEVSQQCHGFIAEKEEGEGGFGYDPVFLYSNTNHSFASMDAYEKDLVSHRGKALREFKKALMKYIKNKKEKNMEEGM